MEGGIITSVNIHGAEYPLKAIFSDDFAFSIPGYQRPYSWEQDQVAELLDDLLTSVKSESDVELLEPYFLGSIVLIKGDQSAESEVVDGQQRLTTLTILLAALADVLPEDQAKDVQPFLFQAANRLAGTKAKYRLEVRERDAKFFREFIQEPGGLARLATMDAAQLGETERRIRSNALLVRKELVKLTAPTIQRLASFMMQSTYLVAVSTPNWNAAYRIFSVLNERGLDLSHSDIFKARVIGNIPEAERERYTKLWEDLEDELGRDRFSELFSHIRMIFAKTKQRGTIPAEFDSFVFPKVPPGAQFVTDVLVPRAQAFQQILDRSYVSSQAAEQVNRMFSWLLRLDNRDYMPPAIAWLVEHGEDEALVLGFMTDLERLAASMLIRRVDVTRRIERYGRLLTAIEAGRDPFAEESPLQLSKQERVATLQGLDGGIYEATRVRQYVLLRLDAALSAGGATYDYPVISIEHVLPQTVHAGSSWAATFSDAERWRWVHRLANLVLLTRRKNAQASNYEFGKKKDLYFKGKGGTSSFHLTTQVLAEDTWTMEVLERRQQYLLYVLSDLWRLG